MSFVGLASLTWPEAAEIAAAGRVLGLVPLGATEQHGPHLPLATDTLIAEVLAREVAEQLDVPVVVTPVPPGGLSTHHLGFPGTVTIPEAAFRAWVVASVEALERMGIREIAVFSAHGGNFAFLRELAVGYGQENPGVTLVAYDDLTRYFGLTIAAAREVGLELPASDAHAGGAETSQALAMFPELVRPFVGVTGYTAAEEGWMQRVLVDGIAAMSPTGVLGDPSGASARTGEAIFEALTAELSRWIGEAFGVGYAAGPRSASA